MSDTPEPDAQPKRRWFQYSLRTLLIFMVVLSFLFAWAGYKVREAVEQKEALEAIGAVAFYGYEHELDATGKLIPDSLAPRPRWLCNLIGPDLLGDVVAVAFIDVKVSDARLEHLQRLTNLKG